MTAMVKKSTILCETCWLRDRAIVSWEDCRTSPKGLIRRLSFRLSSHQPFTHDEMSPV